MQKFKCAGTTSKLYIFLDILKILKNGSTLTLESNALAFIFGMLTHGHELMPLLANTHSLTLKVIKSQIINSQHCLREHLSFNNCTGSILTIAKCKLLHEHGQDTPTKIY